MERKSVTLKHTCHNTNCNSVDRQNLLGGFSGFMKTSGYWIRESRQIKRDGDSRNMVHGDLRVCDLNFKLAQKTYRICVYGEPVGTNSEGHIEGRTYA